MNPKKPSVSWRHTRNLLLTNFDVTVCIVLCITASQARWWSTKRPNASWTRACRHTRTHLTKAVLLSRLRWSSHRTDGSQLGRSASWRSCFQHGRRWLSLHWLISWNGMYDHSPGKHGKPEKVREFENGQRKVGRNWNQFRRRAELPMTQVLLLVRCPQIFMDTMLICL